MSISRFKTFVKGLMWKTGLEVRYAAPHDALAVQKKLLAGRPVEFVVDGGGHYGDWTTNYRAAFPSATVTVFEPFPTCVQALERSFGSDRQVKLVGKALGETTGERTLFCNRLSATNSLFQVDPAIRELLPDPEWVTPEAEMKIPVVTLDEYCQEAGVSRVNLLKLDVQGSELLALRGAEKLLARAAVDLIYTELLFRPHYQGQAYFFEVAEFLHRHGYSLHGLYNLGVGKEGKMWQADGIFVRAGLAEANGPAAAPAV